MRKYLLHVLIISFVFILAPAAHVATYAGEIEDAKEEVRNNPDDADAHCNLGTAYAKSGKWKEAIKACKQAVRLDPDFASAYTFLGLAYGQLGNDEESMICYRKAISIDPDDALAHYGLGVVYLHPYLNDIDSALKQYKILKKLDTERANQLFNYIYKE